MVLCINEIVPSYVVMSLNFVKSRQAFTLVACAAFIVFLHKLLQSEKKRLGKVIEWPLLPEKKREIP